MTHEESIRAWEEAKTACAKLSYKEDKLVVKEYEKKEHEAFKAIVPEEGCGCTVCYWSDRRAATIVRVVSPRMVVIRFNEVECIDYYAGDWKVLPDLDNHPEKVFTKRKNGAWIQQGQETKDGVQLMLHYQSHYIDPHF